MQGGVGGGIHDRRSAKPTACFHQRPTRKSGGAAWGLQPRSTVQGDGYRLPWLRSPRCFRPCPSVTGDGTTAPRKSRKACIDPRPSTKRNNLRRCRRCCRTLPIHAHAREAPPVDPPATTVIGRPGPRHRRGVVRHYQVHTVLVGCFAPCRCHPLPEAGPAPPEVCRPLRRATFIRRSALVRSCDGIEEQRRPYPSPCLPLSSALETTTAHLSKRFL